MKYTVVLLVMLSTVSCQDDGMDTKEPALPFQFENGFETNGNDIEDLLLPDGSSWTNIQQQDPNNGSNSISISKDMVKDGLNALKIIALPSDDVLSKADIEKFGFRAPVGSTVTIEADIYINSTEDLTDLFLLDLECCSCWDSSVADNQCPGIRLKIGGENEYLSIERGKIVSSTITQAAVSFPKLEWVNVVWQMELSPDDDGKNSLFLNGIEVISAAGKNMPNAELFRQEFAANGIDFNLPEEIFYERVQIGATANPTSNTVEMYVDNFKLFIE